MKNYRLLFTAVDGSQATHSVDAESFGHAVSLALSHVVIDQAQIASVDLLTKDDDPAVAKARKSKKRPSRADRFSNAVSDIEQSRSEIEELRDELQNWRDNLPENLQNGSKADELDEAISALEDALNDAESAAGHDGNVNFPGMF